MGERGWEWGGSGASTAHANLARGRVLRHRGGTRRLRVRRGTLSDANARSARIVEEIQKKTLAIIRPYALLAAPLVLVVTFGEIARGHVTIWLISEPIAIGAMGLALLFVKSTRALSAVVCAGLISLGTAALVHFGPMLGTGLLFSLAVLHVTFLFGGAAMRATLAYFTAVMALASVASTAGWEPAWLPGVLTPLDWARLTVGMVVMLGGLGLLFEHVQQSMRDAIASEVDARLRQAVAEEERERALTAGITAKRLETVGQLASGVAHDLNNTLIVIQGTFDALPHAHGTERAELLTAGTIAVRNASNTVSRMLGLGRRSVGELGTCDPATLVDEVLHAMERTLPAGLVVDTEIAPGTTAKISRSALEQVLSSLVWNAAEATGSGGHVSVRSRLGPEGHLLLTVTDDGPGMSPEVRHRAFDPFFTTKPRGEGAGLGLTLAQRLVHNAGGTIRVVDPTERGCVVEVDLPAERAARPTPAPPEADRPARILLVEDDALVAKVLERALRVRRYAVTVAGTVGEADTRLQAPAFDLLITDGQLPDGNAGDVITLFRRHHPTHPVLLCSGYLDDDATLSVIQRDRGLAVLQKPFQSSTLLAHVGHLLDPAAAEAKRC